MKKALSFTLVVLIFGCSNDSRPAPASPSEGNQGSICVEIATACHEYEGHSAKAKACHEMGHSKDATEEHCQLRRSECLNECNAAAEAAAKQVPGEGSSHDAGAHEHEH